MANLVTYLNTSTNELTTEFREYPAAALAYHAERGSVDEIASWTDAETGERREVRGGGVPASEHLVPMAW